MTDSLKYSVKARAFTILELLVAMAVSALLLIVLMGMINSATRLWWKSETRAASYREARAAIGMLAHDLRNAFATGNTNYILINARARLKLPPEGRQDAGAIFFLATQPPVAQNLAANRSDLCEVGYFLAYGKTALVTNGRSAMNLYRYFCSSDGTFSNLTIGPGALFDTGSLTGTRVELLAKNVKDFRVIPYHVNASGSVTAYDPANGAMPDMVELSITVLNQDTAKKLPTVEDWIDPSGTLEKVVARVQQTFTTRVPLKDKP